jgi:hypothetical protein
MRDMEDQQMDDEYGDCNIMGRPVYRCVRSTGWAREDRGSDFSRSLPGARNDMKIRSITTGEGTWGCL